MGYSSPIKKKISYQKLKNKIFSIPDQPNAIPYMTSYYEKNWGFCMSHKKKKKLKKNDVFDIFINSKFSKGHLNYGELFIKGKSSQEILLSSYVCHPH